MVLIGSVCAANPVSEVTNPKILAPRTTPVMNFVQLHYATICKITESPPKIMSLRLDIYSQMDRETSIRSHALRLAPRVAG